MELKKIKFIDLKKKCKNQKNCNYIELKNGL